MNKIKEFLNSPEVNRLKEIFKLFREPLIINYQEHFSNLSRNFS